MDFHRIPFKSTTRTLNCFYTIVLVILTGLCETGRSDHAQDFQKNSKLNTHIFVFSLSLSFCILHFTYTPHSFYRVIWNKNYGWKKKTDWTGEWNEWEIKTSWNWNNFALFSSLFFIFLPIYVSRFFFYLCNIIIIEFDLIFIFHFFFLWFSDNKYFFFCSSFCSRFDFNIVPVRVVWAVKNKDVDLPCDITTTVAGDYPKLILWFKDSVGIPLYRYVRNWHCRVFFRIQIDLFCQKWS